MYRIINEQVRQNAINEIQSLPLGQYEITVKKITKDKTAQQRKYWHKLMDIIANDVGMDMEVLKRQIKISLGQYKLFDRYNLYELEHVTYIELFSSEDYNREEYGKAITATLKIAHTLNINLPDRGYYGYDI